jgi:hypothetical protein
MICWEISNFCKIDGDLHSFDWAIGFNPFSRLFDLNMNKKPFG